MAKKDVVRYFLEVQNQYFEMLNDLNDVNEAFKNKLMTEEQYNDYNNEINIVKNNYDRLAYVMLLLNKPVKKSKKGKEEQQNKVWYDYLKGASKEAILDENKDALCDLKALIKKTKEETNDN